MSFLNRMQAAVAGLLLFLAAGTAIGQNKSPVALRELANNTSFKEAVSNR